MWVLPRLKEGKSTEINSSKGQAPWISTWKTRPLPLYINSIKPFIFRHWNARVNSLTQHNLAHPDWYRWLLPSLVSKDFCLAATVPTGTVIYFVIVRPAKQALWGTYHCSSFVSTRESPFTGSWTKAAVATEICILGTSWRVTQLACTPKDTCLNCWPQPWMSCACSSICSISFRQEESILFLSERSSLNFSSLICFFLWFHSFSNIPRTQNICWNLGPLCPPSPPPAFFGWNVCFSKTQFNF